MSAACVQIVIKQAELLHGYLFVLFDVELKINGAIIQLTKKQAN